MSISSTPSKGWAAIGQASKALSEQDRAVRDQADIERTTEGAMSLSSIMLRHADTRPINAAHVAQLAESIAAVGLLEPLVVDRKGRLLAGGHRLEALRLLVEQDAEKRAKAWASLAQLAWAIDSEAHLPVATVPILATIRGLTPLPSDVVPVRIMDIDANENQDKALAIEIAENEKRRDYTRQEVAVIADRLKAAGFRMARGKPKTGERALGPALAVIIGKSERQVRRILGGESDIRTDVLISDRAVPLALGRLQTAIKALQAAATGHQKRRLAEVLTAAETLSATIVALDEI